MEHVASARFVSYFVYIINENLENLKTLHLSSKFKIPITNIDDNCSINLFVDLWTTFFTLHNIRCERITERTVMLHFDNILSKRKILSFISSWKDKLVNANIYGAKTCNLDFPTNNTFYHQCMFKQYGFMVQSDTISWS